MEVGTLTNRFTLTKGDDCACDQPFGSGLEKLVSTSFPQSMEPSFLLYPLDRDETLLLLMRAIIPRKVSNLWIAMGLVTRSQLPARSDWVISRNISRNMQESKELRHEPLLLVVLSCHGGCLKNGRFDESTRHSRYLSQNTVTCSQCYPQKMWNKNSTCGEQASWTSTSTVGWDWAGTTDLSPRPWPALPYRSWLDRRTRQIAPKRALL